MSQAFPHGSVFIGCPGCMRSLVYAWVCVFGRARACCAVVLVCARSVLARLYD